MRKHSRYRNIIVDSKDNTLDLVKNAEKSVSIISEPDKGIYDDE